MDWREAAKQHDEKKTRSLSRLPESDPIMVRVKMFSNLDNKAEETQQIIIWRFYV